MLEVVFTAALCADVEVLSLMLVSTPANPCAANSQGRCRKVDVFIASGDDRGEGEESDGNGGQQVVCVVVNAAFRVRGSVSHVVSGIPVDMVFVAVALIVGGWGRTVPRFVHTSRFATCGRFLIEGVVSAHSGLPESAGSCGGATGRLCQSVCRLHVYAHAPTLSTRTPRPTTVQVQRLSRCRTCRHAYQQQQQQPSCPCR